MERALQAMVPGREDWAYLFQTPLALAIYATGAAVMVLFFWATRKGRGMGTRVDPRFVAGAAAMLAFAALGLWHVATGTWRPGPGGGPALVPQLAFWAILPSAAVMLPAGIVRPENAQTEAVRLLRSLKIVVPVVVQGCVLAFWIMFTRVAPILQFRVWLL